jgi:hypothetical protein
VAAPAPAGPDTEVLGSTYPRLFTPPLIVGDPGPCGCGCALDEETSYGFAVIEFAADVLRKPLDAWQRWLVIHAGELLPDGRPRFRTVLVLVARQQGKTFLLQVLTLYWLFVELQALVLGTSTNRDYAKEAWRNTVHLAEATTDLAEEIAPNGVREANGEECLTTASRVVTEDGEDTVVSCRYKIAASNRNAGRSLTVNRLVLDELREHQTWDAWNAATNTQNAIPDAQAFAISNQGDNTSVVLDALRAPALEFIETGAGDRRLGLFEWSSPQGSDPTDPRALAAAMPNYGRRTDPDAIIGAAIRAKAAGGEELAGFQTEVMCMRVHLLDPAIEPGRWTDSGTDKPLALTPYRGQVALCLDVSLDGSHASVVAAAVIDGLVHVEVVAAWEGFGCTKQLRAELPALIRKIRPRALGWFPAGPAAAVAADLAERKGSSDVRWPPRGVALEELRGVDLPAVCMGLAEQVFGGEVVHPRDPMLTAHVEAAQKLHRADGWVFTRRGSGPIDGVYALAGAVHLARTLPPAPPPLTAL